MNKFFIYALFVTFIATMGSWASLINSVTGHGGSSWSSGARGGYSGGWSGGGGHK
jgi:hypothetical protein